MMITKLNLTLFIGEILIIKRHAVERSCATNTVFPNLCFNVFRALAKNEEPLVPTDSIALFGSALMRYVIVIRHYQTKI